MCGGGDSCAWLDGHLLSQDMTRHGDQDHTETLGSRLSLFMAATLAVPPINSIRRRNPDLSVVVPESVCDPHTILLHGVLSNFRSRAMRQLEIIAPRHQLDVLRRSSEACGRDTQNTRVSAPDGVYRRDSHIPLADCGYSPPGDAQEGRRTPAALLHHDPATLAPQSVGRGSAILSAAARVPPSSYTEAFFRYHPL